MPIMKHSKIIKPRVIVLSGYGLNCEDETAFAFEQAGATAEIIHINDLGKLDKYQILAVPGGFSFGDDTGSGKAYAHMLKAKLGDELEKFLLRDTLMIGICNGFQILTQLGILPGILTFNDGGRYLSNVVEIVATSSSPWLVGIDKLSIPIANGEGKYIKTGDTTVAFKYVENPNGSQEDIAGVLGYNGRVLGMMPHPERAQFSFQQGGEGLKIFKNAVRYFK